MFNDAEIIPCYSQGQAIEDGLLVPLSGKDYPENGDVWLPQMVKEAGICLPVIVTHRVFDECISPLNEKMELAPCQDIKGRAWDLLLLTAFAMRRYSNSDAANVQLRVRPNVVKDSGQNPRLRVVNLLAELSFNDYGEPCLVIMHPEDR